MTRNFVWFLIAFCGFYLTSSSFATFATKDEMEVFLAKKPTFIEVKNYLGALSISTERMEFLTAAASKNLDFSPSEYVTLYKVANLIRPLSSSRSHDLLLLNVFNNPRGQLTPQLLITLMKTSACRELFPKILEEGLNRFQGDAFFTLWHFALLQEVGPITYKENFNAGMKKLTNNVVSGASKDLLLDILYTLEPKEQELLTKKLNEYGVSIEPKDAKPSSSLALIKYDPAVCLAPSRGLTKPKSQENPSNIAKAERDPKVLAKLLAELAQIEGVEGIKRKVALLRATKVLDNELKKRGLQKTSAVNLNLQFVGPPGTGKTTVARLYGRILKELGFLTNGDFHEFRRADLIGQYCGTPTTKTQAAFEASLGGIMFIDEFHNMLNSKDPSDNDKFGKEALGTLVGLMTDEEKGKQVVVIVAGYKEGMDNVMRQDEGLFSRIPERVEFNELEDSQLISIFKKKAAQENYNISSDLEGALKDRIAAAKNTLGMGFGNGRFINFLFGQALENQVLRVCDSLEKGMEISNEDLKTIEVKDLPKPQAAPKPKKEPLAYPDMYI